MQWYEYIPIYGEVDGDDEIVGKRPKGRKCYLCTVTYRTAGWHNNYETISHYFKFACTPAGRSKHQEFLKKRKALAQRLDEETASGYGLNALKSQLTVGERKSMRTEVRAAGRTELTLNKRPGRRVQAAGGREFVPASKWDDKLDGTLDKSKLV